MHDFIVAGSQLNETAAVSCPVVSIPLGSRAIGTHDLASVDRSIVIQAPEMIEAPLAR